MEMKWIIAGANSFADLLSRIADKLQAVRLDRKAGGSQTPLTCALPLRAHPLSRHSYHEDKKQSGSGEFEMNHLVLSASEWDEVAAAYLRDSRTMHSVTVSDIYRCVVHDGKGVEQMIKMKVKPWIGVRVFAVAPPGAAVQVLYVPRSQQRAHWAEDSANYGRNACSAAPGPCGQVWRIVILFVPWFKKWEKY